MWRCASGIYHKKIISKIVIIWDMWAKNRVEHIQEFEFELLQLLLQAGLNRNHLTGLWACYENWKKNPLKNTHCTWNIIKCRPARRLERWNLSGWKTHLTKSLRAVVYLGGFHFLLAWRLICCRRWPSLRRPRGCVRDTPQESFHTWKLLLSHRLLQTLAARWMAGSRWLERTDSSFQSLHIRYTFSFFF